MDAVCLLLAASTAVMSVSWAMCSSIPLCVHACVRACMCVCLHSTRHSVPIYDCTEGM